jgi:hypothetical protein
MIYVKLYEQILPFSITAKLSEVRIFLIADAIAFWKAV